MLKGFGLFALMCSVLPGTPSFGAGSTAGISVDQAGYLAGEPKLATVVAPGDTPAASFTVVHARDGSAAFQGKLSDPATDPDSGDRVQIADFTGLREPGRYSLVVPGVGGSWQFEIGSDVYRPVFYLAMRAFYGQRCGTAVDLGPEFPGCKHEACHLEGGYDPSSGKSGPHVSSHGWHDAGDYGRYVVNSGISTATLLWTWEFFGDRLGKTSLHLPESGNGTPDILNEIRWNLDWMLTMQDDDGGVWQKQTSTHFCGFIMPERDKLVSYVIGTGDAPFKSSCATADFAAVMAIAGRVYAPFDKDYAGKCLRAAELAWKWVAQNPDVLFKNPPGITTGDYADGRCGDERLWAAAELARTTKKDIYTDYFFQHYREYLGTIRADAPPSWSMVAPLALWTYALGAGADSEAARAIEQHSLDAADAIVARSGRHAYRISLTSGDWIWGSNGVAANYAMQLIVASRFRPSSRTYLEAAMDNVHYLLGRNTFSLSWVTQVGDNVVRHPHHRPSGANSTDLPWPGLLAGGPNRGRQDEVMKKMLSAQLPPAKMYIDQTGAYACNEVAINWNAPLVFALAAMLK